MVENPAFDAAFGVVVLGNCALMGVQCEMEAGNPLERTPPIFRILGCVFWAIFTVELACRVAAHRWTFFVGPNWVWNLVDIALVAISTVEAMSFVADSTHAMTVSSDGLGTTLGLVRAARLARIMRMIRLMRFFRHLRLLIWSIMHTLKSLVGALVLLCMLMYMFGVLFTSAVTDFSASANADISDLKAAFGTLPRSIFSLFKAVTGGQDWGTFVGPLSNISWVYVFLLHSYIAFVYFAVLNTMTGVFCQVALEAAEKDEEVVIQAMMADKEAMLAKLTQVFTCTFESSETGTITIGEFEDHLQDERLLAWFHSLDIEVKDGWTLFKLLDVDRRGFLALDQFVEGCFRLRGQAKKVDVAEMLHDNTWIMGKLRQVETSLVKLQQLLGQTCAPQAVVGMPPAAAGPEGQQCKG